jgi:hypothetical protein
MGIKKSSEIILFFGGVKMFKTDDITNTMKKYGAIFEMSGEKYYYYLHPYNATWRNERSVEIALAKSFMKDRDWNELLEVGNVLNNYDTPLHNVVDKYEKAMGVINEDILWFKANKKFKTIIAISTLEHVGEKENHPKLAIKAVKKLHSMLAPGGQIFCTVPAGFNKELCAALPKLFKHVYGMKQNESGTWIECNIRDLKTIPYDYKNNTARGLYICYS